MWKRVSKRKVGNVRQLIDSVLNEMHIILMMMKVMTTTMMLN